MTSIEKNKMISVTQQIIHGSVGIIEGCRKLVVLDLDSAIRDDDRDFLIIRGIESETAEFPIGNERNYWDKKALEKLDKELSEYIDKIKPNVLKACKNLVDKYKK